MIGRIALGVLAMTISAAASAQPMMPPGYADYVTEGIQWKYVEADGQARFGTVYTDGPTEFAPIFITCRGGQGTIVYTLPQTVDPAQAGSTMRLSLKGRGSDVKVTKTDSMGAPALTGTFELAALGGAQGLTASDMVEIWVGRWKMGYAARDFATAFAAFRQACAGSRR